MNFERKIIDNSNTPQLSIASELLDYLGAEIGDHIEITKERGKHGRFGIIRVCCDNDDEALVKRKIISNNGTPQFSLPAAIMAYLDLDIGDIVTSQADRHGGQKAMTFWNSEQ